MKKKTYSVETECSYTKYDTKREAMQEHRENIANNVSSELFEVKFGMCESLDKYEEKVYLTLLYECEAIVKVEMTKERISMAELIIGKDYYNMNDDEYRQVANMLTEQKYNFSRGNSQVLATFNDLKVKQY